jgi:hypothetical protein
MCIIVDASVMGDLAAPTDDGKPVLNWLLRGKGGLIVGGHLTTELARSSRLRATFVVLNQAGRLHRLDDSKVREVTEQIKTRDVCCSDDWHLIAVTIISGCRLIFTRDIDLGKDLKNKDIVTPTASIYKTKDHKHLLTTCDCI